MSLDANQPVHSEVTLSREQLTRQTRAVLQRGSPRNPDVLLVDTGAERVVVKDFAPRSAWVRATLGRWSTAREARAYRTLNGHPAVPRLLGQLDPLSLIIEYRPGRRMTAKLARQVPPGFVEELERIVSDFHARGVVHLDLSHRTNVLADPSGKPVVIDFASAICFKPGSWAARMLLPWLARWDMRALRKWETKFEKLDRLEAQRSLAEADSASSRGGRAASRPT